MNIGKEYYNKLKREQQLTLTDAIQRELTYLNQLVQISAKLDDGSKKERLELQLKKYYEGLIEI